MFSPILNLRIYNFFFQNYFSMWWTKKCRRNRLFKKKTLCISLKEKIEILKKKRKKKIVKTCDALFCESAKHGKIRVKCPWRRYIKLI